MNLLDAVLKFNSFYSKKLNEWPSILHQRSSQKDIFKTQFLMKFSTHLHWISGNGPETQRGCFNKVLLEIILQGDGKDVSDLEMGCHKFPEVYGQGTICVCDSSLCNSSPHSLLRPEGTWLMTTVSVAMAATFQRHLSKWWNIWFHKNLSKNLGQLVDECVASHRLKSRVFYGCRCVGVSE